MTDASLHEVSTTHHRAQGSPYNRPAGLLAVLRLGAGLLLGTILVAGVIVCGFMAKHVEFNLLGLHSNGAPRLDRISFWQGIAVAVIVLVGVGSAYCYGYDRLRKYWTNPVVGALWCLALLLGVIVATLFVARHLTFDLFGVASSGVSTSQGTSFKQGIATGVVGFIYAGLAIAAIPLIIEPVLSQRRRKHAQTAEVTHLDDLRPTGTD